MSKTKFKPIVIGVNTSIQSEYKRLLEAKRSDLRDLKAYASRFVEIESFDILFKDFSQTFRDRFAAKFESQFPSLVNYIALNEDLEPTESPDFNIYTKDDKQNLLYETLERICDDYSTLKSQGLTIFPMAICNGTQQALKYDFSTQSLTPNISVFSPNWGKY